MHACVVVKINSNNQEKNLPDIIICQSHKLLLFALGLFLNVLQVLFVGPEYPVPPDKRTGVVTVEVVVVKVMETSTCIYGRTSNGGN